MLQGQRTTRWKITSFQKDASLADSSLSFAFLYPNQLEVTWQHIFEYYRHIPTSLQINGAAGIACMHSSITRTRQTHSQEIYMAIHSQIWQSWVKTTPSFWWSILIPRAADVLGLISSYVLCGSFSTILCHLHGRWYHFRCYVSFSS